MKGVFVGNLDSGTTPETIRAVFDPHGEAKAAPRRSIAGRASVVFRSFRD